MPVAPLYNTDMASLLERVRMSSADDTDTLALIDQTVSEVRLGFFRSLGKSRAVTIVGYALVDNPLSDNEVLKAGAANTEALWVTWLLAQRLPHLFMDNSASTGDAFNDEQLTRDASGLHAFLKALKVEIDQGLGDLMSPVSETAGSPKSSAIKNETTNLVYDNFVGLYPRGTN